MGAELFMVGKDVLVSDRILFISKEIMKMLCCFQMFLTWPWKWRKNYECMESYLRLHKQSPRDSVTVMCVICLLTTFILVLSGFEIFCLVQTTIICFGDVIQVDLVSL